MPMHARDKSVDRRKNGLPRGEDHQKRRYHRNHARNRPSPAKTRAIVLLRARSRPPPRQQLAASPPSQRVERVIDLQPPTQPIREEFERIKSERRHSPHPAPKTPRRRHTTHFLIVKHSSCHLPAARQSHPESEQNRHERRRADRQSRGARQRGDPHAPSASASGRSTSRHDRQQAEHGAKHRGRGRPVVIRITGITGDIEPAMSGESGDKQSPCPHPAHTRHPPSPHAYHANPEGQLRPGGSGFDRSKQGFSRPHGTHPPKSLKPPAPR